MGKRKKMRWIFSYRLKTFRAHYSLIKGVIELSLISIFLLHFSGCGRVYFPIELETIPRSDRAEKQQKSDIIVIPMTVNNIKKANSSPYERHIIEAGDLEEPAKFIPASLALVENFPKNNDPGPYLIGVGDVLGYEELIGERGSIATKIIRNLTVNEDGLINFFQLGRIKAEGRTLSELEDLIYKKVVDSGGDPNFNLFVKDFRSKQIIISIGMNAKSVPYISTPIYIEQILGDIKLNETIDAKISIYRNGSEFVFSLKKLILKPGKRFRLFPGDRVFVTTLNYRAEKVLLIGETGAQRAITINSITRPSLSDTVFAGNILNNVTSDFSQIYVLREEKKTFRAYHLDITNPTRVSLANKFEMRPDDVVFVATQPLSLYSRTLSQILGSTGLTLQARDTIRSEIGN